MKILALDPAKNCGWAWEDTEVKHSLQYGTWNLGKAGELGQQHEHLASNLIRLIASLNSPGVDFIATENAGFGSINPATQAMHNERLGIIRSVAARYNVRLHTFQPSTIKLHATGHGHADKKQMIAAAARFHGLRNLTEDEADAFWILELAKRPDCWPEPKKPKAKRRSKSKPVKKLF